MLERGSEACLTVLRLSLRAQGNTAHCYMAGRLPMHNSVGHGMPCVAEAAARNPHAIDPQAEPSARTRHSRGRTVWTTQLQQTSRAAEGARFGTRSDDASNTSPRVKGLLDPDQTAPQRHSRTELAGYRPNCPYVQYHCKRHAEWRPNCYHERRKLHVACRPTEGADVIYARDPRKQPARVDTRHTHEVVASRVAACTQPATQTRGGDVRSGVSHTSDFGRPPHVLHNTCAEVQAPQT